MTAIEQSYIKGMTWKLFVTIIGSTITICSTALYTYYDFKTSVHVALEQSSQALQETAVLRHSDTIQNNSISVLQGNQRILMFQMDQLYTKPK
jgi:hypothetical protein